MFDCEITVGKTQRQRGCDWKSLRATAFRTAFRFNSKSEVGHTRAC